MSPQRLVLATALVALVAALGGWPARADAEEGEPTTLRVRGMTFVGSRGAQSELVLRADRATFVPDTDVAKLEEVRATVADEEKGRSFEMTCDRGELNVETNDFLAEGRVRGVTEDGQRYTADWVRYQHEEGLLFTDAPVVMVDNTGTYRGDGFRYHLDDRRFRLLGNVSVVQE